MEKIIVILVVALASLYFLRYSWRSIKGLKNLAQSKTAGCNGCGCGPKKQGPIT